MQEGLLHFRKGCGAGGSWGSLRGGHCQGKPLPRRHQCISPVGCRREGACVAVGAAAGGTSALCASALSHTVLREDGRASAKVISQLCHRSVSQGESESPWADPVPGVTALALPFSHPLGARSRRVPTHGAPNTAWPRSCQPRCPPGVHSWWRWGRGTQLPSLARRQCRSLVPKRGGGRTVPYLQKPTEKHPGLHPHVSQGHVWKQGSP